MNSSAPANLPAVDVIVRTLAEKKRKASLARALDSIRNQTGVDARAIVVVNGDRFDPVFVDELKQCRGIKFDYLSEGSLIASHRRGVELVDAPVFMFLDDDDELRPDSLAEPLAWLGSHPNNEVVITLTDMSSRGGDGATGHGWHADMPMRALLDSCWLHPGSGFFRNTAAIKQMADVSRSHMEWTAIAFRLLTHGVSIHFMDVATVVYHDTDASLSKNTAHQEAEIDLMREIMSAGIGDSRVTRRAREKYLNTLHTLAATYHADGRHLDAWRAHLKSLAYPGFFKYLLYTRKLLG